MRNLINTTNITSSKNFEKKVVKFFPNTDNRDIYLDLVGMFRNSGHGGRYLNKVGFYIGNEYLELSYSHNDSAGFDWYTDAEVWQRNYQNWAKSTVLSLLAENKDKITEFFFEEELESNI